MSPWTILGWVIIAIVGLFILRIVLRIFVPAIIDIKEYLQRYWGYLKTRNQAPEPGQTWRSSAYTYVIQRSYVEGKISVKTSGNIHATNITPEEWKRWVKGSKLRRVA